VTKCTPGLPDPGNKAKRIGVGRGLAVLSLTVGAVLVEFMNICVQHFREREGGVMGTVRVRCLKWSMA
jgi:hypothetical protein